MHSSTSTSSTVVVTVLATVGVVAAAAMLAMRRMRRASAATDDTPNVEPAGEDALGPITPTRYNPVFVDDEAVHDGGLSI